MSTAPISNTTLTEACLVKPPHRRSRIFISTAQRIRRWRRCYVVWRPDLYMTFVCHSNAAAVY